jgi:hypothetical protein
MAHRREQARRAPPAAALLAAWGALLLVQACAGVPPECAGAGCVDGGAGPDAGGGADAGPPDSGLGDAGATPDAGAAPDAGVTLDAGPAAADLRVPEDRRNVVLLSYEPWHGPGFDNDQRGAGARPPGIGAGSIQPLGAEPGVDPANAEDPFAPSVQGQTFTYQLCTGAPATSCSARSFTTSFTTTGYSSANPGVIARHRRQIKALGADALLFDVTNGLSRYPANPPGNALYDMMHQSVPALYAGLSGADKGDLKLVPLIGVLEGADVSDADHGFGKLLDDWYLLATFTAPGRNLLYEGKPLAVLFHAVETHAAACQGAALPCWKLARDYLASHRPSTSRDAGKSWFDYVTFRHMGGLYDSQPGARDEEYPGTGASRVTGSGAVPTFWTWVDRYAPAYGLNPSYAATSAQLAVGAVEAFTACNAVAGAAWGSGDDGTGYRAYINGVVASNPLDYCYETRRGAFSCSWGRPGRYAPDATLRRVGDVWALQRYLELASALRPTFLVVNQWNQFEQTDEGFDFQTTHDLEPANWGLDALTGAEVDAWAPYRMAQAGLAAYRAGLSSGRVRDFSYRAGVTAHPIVAGLVLPAGGWQLALAGAGPSLQPYLSTPLPDPALTTYDGAGQPTASNDDCSAATKDACLSWAHASGTLTVALSSADGRSGTALLDVRNAGASALPNASARSFLDVASAEGKPIAGFVVEDGPRRVFLIGRGPSLAAVGLQAAGATTLTLFRGSAPIAHGEVYGSATPAEVDALRAGLGAQPLAPGDSYLVVSLPPGAYSAPLDAASSGHAMIDLYDVTDR